MTREQFEAALVRAPNIGEPGEVLFDFSGLPQAPCIEFRYQPADPWDGDGVGMEECWRAYLLHWEDDWDF